MIKYYKYRNSLMNIYDYEAISLADGKDLSELEEELVNITIDKVPLPEDTIEYYDINRGVPFYDANRWQENNGVENEICIYYNFDEEYEESEYVVVYYREISKEEYCELMIEG